MYVLPNLDQKQDPEHVDEIQFFSTSLSIFVQLMNLSNTQAAICAQIANRGDKQYT